MKRSIASIFGTLFGLLLSGAAWSITFTVGDNLGARYIGGGSSVVGQFDITSALGGPDFNQPYELTSAVFSFAFSDDGDTPVYESGPTLGAYQFWGGPFASISLRSLSG